MTAPQQYDAIPQTLRSRPQWGRWRVEHETKVPYHATAEWRASSSDPKTWSAYADALAHLGRRDAGLAWFFADDDGLTGVDLDKCIIEGVISPAAKAILAQLNSYSEISPSGTGIKVWVKGKLPAALKKSDPEPGILRIEIYSRGRFFAVTGQRLDEYPAEPQEAQEALDMLARKYGKPEPVASPQAIEGTRTDNADSWARSKLNTAITKVIAAAEGSKHDELLGAARLAGGLTAHFSVMQIETALEAALRAHGTVKDWRGAMKTIQDGIRMGQAEPLQPPAESPPLQWRGKTPYCPSCGSEARTSQWGGLWCNCQKPALKWKDLAALAPGGGAPELVESKAPTLASAVYRDTPPMPISARDLAKKQIAPTRYYIPDMLRSGLALFIGNPGIGKTPALIQLALAFASGGAWMGSLPCRKARCYTSAWNMTKPISKRYCSIAPGRLM
jgi:hypothetical protein